MHGGAESFWVIVEDVDGEIVLFADTFVLRERYAEDEHTLPITVPMFEPVPPNYYVSVISNNWLNCEFRLPISFQGLILPEKFPPPTFDPAHAITENVDADVHTPAHKDFREKYFQGFKKGDVSAGSEDTK